MSLPKLSKIIIGFENPVKLEQTSLTNLDEEDPWTPVETRQQWVSVGVY